jgi:NHL repeat
MFRQVTDVAWDGAGNAYISDGYINSRVAKVDKDGNWLKSWGEAGSGPGQFNVPHSIAVDASGHVYVADRGNRRIQVFDGDGNFLRQFTIDVPVDPNARPAIGNKPTASTGAMAPGAPRAICITPGPHQVMPRRERDLRGGVTELADPEADSARPEELTINSITVFGKTWPDIARSIQAHRDLDNWTSITSRSAVGAVFQHKPPIVIHPRASTYEKRHHPQQQIQAPKKLRKLRPQAQVY